MFDDDLFTPRPDAAPARKTLSVTELNRRIKALIERECGTLWVEGEVSNVSYQSSGHIYFTLKDAGSEIRVAFFKGQQRGCSVRVVEGIKIQVFADVTLYLQRGYHQLIAKKIEESGKGDLQKAFEELKRKLQEEGLFEAERKRPLPFLPRHIGIVTSPTGAAIRDMLSVLDRRFANLHIVLAPVKVQGEGAAAEIARAIDLLNTRGDLEVLIVGRGGGSIEDLWAFNEEAVARAVARSRLPVISAVGHEIDFTICDFVADLRAPTPSAAAELVVRPRADLEEQVRGYGRRLRQALERRVLQWRTRLVRAAHSYVFREPRNLLRQHRQSVEGLRFRLVTALRGAYIERQQRVDEAQAILLERMRSGARERALHLRRIEAQLRSLNPHAVLERGYSITKTAEGHVLSKAANARPGMTITTQVSDGSFTSVVKAAEKT